MLTPGTNEFDTTCRRFSPDAFERRIRNGVSLQNGYPITMADLPISATYLQELQKNDLTIRGQSRWLNAVSIEAGREVIEHIRHLPFVKKITPVAKNVSIRDTLGLQASAVGLPEQHIQALTHEYGYDSIIYHYGQTASQLDRINVRPLHAMGLDATRVKLGYIDTGFRWKEMTATRSRQIVKEYDFVKKDNITANQAGDHPDQDGHGSLVLAIAAGYIPDVMIGPAYNASLYLAKTEDITSETPIEEDNYVEALEWMESQGVQIVSSSLGYFFYDSGYKSYSYADMNGKTAMCSRAAETAASLGVLVVTAMGNGGTTEYPYLIAPADADKVISVGALELDDSKAGFSSLGPSSDGRIKPEICAPGVHVVTMSTANEIITPNGTSVATPLVSSASALILQAHPEATAEQIRHAVTRTGTQSTAPDSSVGYGKLNAYAAALELGTVITSPVILSNDTLHSTMVAMAANNMIKSPKVIYAVEDRMFTHELPLTLAADSLIYTAEFPSLPRGTRISYYYQTSDGADTLTKLPRNAPISFYEFYIGDVPSQYLKNVYIFPNPANEYIELAGSINNALITLRDMLGRNIISLQTSPFTYRYKIDTQNIGAGNYIIEVRPLDGNSILRTKAVIIR
jgi:hypothetical protein